MAIRTRKPSAARIERERERFGPRRGPTLDPRGGQYVSETERRKERRRVQRVASLAPVWLEKYWEAIDCDELELAASVTLAEGWRLERSAGPVYRKMAALLATQRKARGKMLAARLRGRPESFLDLASREADADRAGHSPRLASLARVFLDAWQKYEGAATDFAESLDQWTSKASGASGPVTRAEDAELARAAFVISEWIRARHRSPGGTFDGRTSWPDVTACLEWYGHDLSHVEPDNRPHTIRLLVSRFKRKRQAPAQ